MSIADGTVNNMLLFIKEVYEFFHTDFIWLHDFLNHDTPWDRTFMYKFNIDKNLLKELKTAMRDSIVATYQKQIVETVLTTKKLYLVDKPIFEEMDKGHSLTELFTLDYTYTMPMHRLFLASLKGTIDIKVDSYHMYYHEIKFIMDHCEDIYAKSYEYGNTEERNYERLYENISDELIPKIVQFFQSSFRSIQEEENFMDYLYSLVYGYLYKMSEDEGYLEASEKEIIDTIESQKNTREDFYFNNDSAMTIIDSLYSLYEEYGENYDLRRSINNQHAQELFARLDSNYLNEFEAPFMVNNFNIDKRLEELLLMLGDYAKVDDIANLLTSSESIYDLLFSCDLDARLSDTFKQYMIGKILGDVFEFESYNKKSCHFELDWSCYEDLKFMDTSAESKYSYFLDHYSALLSYFYLYHSQSEYYREQAMLHIYNSGEQGIVARLNLLSKINYVGMECGKITPLLSVDYINQMLNISHSNCMEEINSHFEPLEYERHIKAMCLNVYEHLLLEKNKTMDILNLITLFETEDNIAQYLQEHPEQLMKIIQLFTHYNPSEVSYSSEINIRSMIDRKFVKTMKKLNPFDGEKI